MMAERATVKEAVGLFCICRGEIVGRLLKICFPKTKNPQS